MSVAMLSRCAVSKPHKQSHHARLQLLVKHGSQLHPLQVLHPIDRTHAFCALMMTATPNPPSTPDRIKEELRHFTPRSWCHGKDIATYLLDTYHEYHRFSRKQVASLFLRGLPRCIFQAKVSSWPASSSEPAQRKTSHFPHFAGTGYSWEA